MQTHQKLPIKKVCSSQANDGGQIRPVGRPNALPLQLVLSRHQARLPVHPSRRGLLAKVYGLRDVD